MNELITYVQENCLILYLRVLSTFYEAQIWKDVERIRVATQREIKVIRGRRSSSATQLA